MAKREHVTIVQLIKESWILLAIVWGMFMIGYVLQPSLRVLLASFLMPSFLVLLVWMVGCFCEVFEAGVDSTPIARIVVLVVSVFVVSCGLWAVLTSEPKCYDESEDSSDYDPVMSRH